MYTHYLHPSSCWLYCPGSCASCGLFALTATLQLLQALSMSGACTTTNYLDDLSRSGFHHLLLLMPRIRFPKSVRWRAGGGGVERARNTHQLAGRRHYCKNLVQTRVFSFLCCRARSGHTSNKCNSFHKNEPGTKTAGFGRRHKQEDGGSRHYIQFPQTTTGKERPGEGNRQRVCGRVSRKGEKTLELDRRRPVNTTRSKCVSTR